MRSTSTVTIHLPSIDRNVAAIRDLVGPSCGVCAVVKADGYGLGAGRVAQQLAASGVSMLAVYSLAQAESIADAGVTLPMLVLMPVREVELGGAAHRLLITGRLHLTVHSLSHAQGLAAMAERLGGGPVPVHLEVDTGMSRGGSLPEDAARALAFIAGEGRLRLTGLFTHFSDSRLDPELTAAQLNGLDALLSRCAESIPSDVVIHAANSHALARGARFHRTMVRVGLAWTGLADPGVEGVVSWTSSIVHVKEIPTGTPVGYGSKWRAARPTRVAVIPVGYFDGYPLGGADSESRFVSIGSRDAMVIGAVNMDQIVVDITGIEPSLSSDDGFIGRTVELYGGDRAKGNFIPRLAEAVGAHAYELLCRIHPRIPRQFVAAPTVAPRIEAMPPVAGSLQGAIAS